MQVVEVFLDVLRRLDPERPAGAELGADPRREETKLVVVVAQFEKPSLRYVHLAPRGRDFISHSWYPVSDVLDITGRPYWPHRTWS